MGIAATEVVRRVLSRNPKRAISDTSLTPAGVMLLLYSKNGEYYVLLNKRTEDVEHHKGEVSFPGGSKDENDDTLLTTALRETHEEMGISPDDVELLGELDDMATSTRFLINPFVGSIPYPYVFKPSLSEVAEVLEVPVAALTDSQNLRDEIRIVEDDLVRTPVYAHQGHLIHGATARVLTHFLGLMDGVPDKEALWRKR